MKRETWSPLRSDGTVDAAALALPLQWRKPRHVEVCDIFRLTAAHRDLEAVFGVMGMTRHHAYWFATSEPKSAVDFLGSTSHGLCVAEVLVRDVPLESPKGRRYRAENMGAGWPWPLPNLSIRAQETR